MSPMTPLVAAPLLLLLFAWAGVLEAVRPPHRTVLDLSRFNRTFDKPFLDPKKPNVTLGFLTSFKDIGKLLIAGAVPLAVDLVNEDPQLLPSHNLQFKATDSGDADSALPLRMMTQMRENGVAGFIGLDGGCEHEALLAAAWDMTIFSYRCSDSKVSDKSKYPTFARTLPPGSKVSKSLISLLQHYGWRRLMLLVANDTSSGQIADALSGLAAEHSINIVETFTLPGDYLTKDNTTLKNIVLQTYTRTRAWLTEYWTRDRKVAGSSLVVSNQKTPWRGDWCAFNPS